MFDFTSTKLLILAIVALLVVGPKDLPILLRAAGKYLGFIRRHTAEFRAQLDDVLAEAEMQELRKEFESVGKQLESTVREGGAAIDRELEMTRRGLDDSLENVRRDVGVPAAIGSYRKPAPTVTSGKPIPEDAPESEFDPHVTE